MIDIESITAEKLLWAFEKDEKTGNVTIVPMNDEQIVIHGKTEAKMFCNILTGYFWRCGWKRTRIKRYSSK